VGLRVTNTYGDVALAVTDLDVGDRSPSVLFIGAVPTSALEDEQVAYEVRYESPADEVMLIEWDFGDGSTAQGTRATHAWEEAGTYTVVVTVLDEDGSTGAISVDVTVANAVPVAVVPPGPLQARKGVEVLLDGSRSHDTPSDNGTLLHAWDLGGGRTKLGALVYHAFPRAGEYTVRLTVTDRDGASSTATLRVVVSNEPPRLQPLPDVVLREGDPPHEVLLGSFLSDPDDEVANLTVSVSVVEGDAVTATVAWNITRGWVVTVTPAGHGHARVLVTSVDVDLGSAVTDFNVTVSPAPGTIIDRIGGGWWVALLILAAIVGVVVALVVFRVWRRART
jgi:PKD repeat protein